MNLKTLFAIMFIGMTAFADQALKDMGVFSPTETLHKTKFEISQAITVIDRSESPASEVCYHIGAASNYGYLSLTLQNSTNPNTKEIGNVLRHAIGSGRNFCLGNSSRAEIRDIFSKALKSLCELPEDTEAYCK